MGTRRERLTSTKWIAIRHSVADYYGVLYLPDASTPAADVADMVHAMLEAHPQEELEGLQFVGAEWL